MRHPLHNLPVSQAAYLAEMLTDYPIPLDELYVEMVQLWPGLTRDNFCCQVRRLRKHIGLRVSRRGVWVSRSTQGKIKDALYLEKCRVSAMITCNKNSRIELKKL